MGRKPKMKVNEDTGEIKIESNYSLPVSEQECVISFMRDEDFATVYSSDSTMITKLDKLCKNSPEYYSLIEETKYGNKYKITYKSLIRLRQKKREVSDEMKEIASERFKKLHAEGKINRNKKAD